MKDFFGKFAKVILIVAAAVLTILVVFGVVLLLDWPWWSGFFILSWLLGLGVGVLFLRKIWLRRKEQRFVQQVIEQDEARLGSVAGKEREDLNELQDRWSEAIETLRHSHLKKYGNPLYVLPWYVVIGESGSGKTTAISSARLSSPFVEVRRTAGISGTKNCDWWFFEQAVILDTAGRYAIPVDEGRDKEEWQKFLNLLLKYRRKEPLNGVVVTVAADKLLGGGPSVLEEDGRNIRRRIDELMRALGTKVPVYVLVTKCDQVRGMAQFCDRLPEKSLDQAMGLIREDLSASIDSFQERAFSTIGERLRNLRVLLLHQAEDKGVDPALLLFPEEFEQLKQGLRSFTDGAFKENPDQETPILRGLFFSSGRQEGTPYSHFLRALGLIGEKEVLPGTSRGLFLHDLFARVLPRDRGLLAPTQRVLQWRSLTKNLGLVAWVALGIAFCGLLSFSFVKNLGTLRGFSHQFAEPPALQGEIMADLATMNRFREAILKMEAQNRSWWIPRLGLTESIRVEAELKGRFCAQFQKEFLVLFDKQIWNSLTSLTTSAPDEVIARYVSNLVRRINLLKGRLEGQGLEALQKRPRPTYEPPAGVSRTVGPGGIREQFGHLYLYYVAWRSDPGEVNKDITILQSWLRHVLALRSYQLNWLASWVNGQGSVPWITLGDFWGGRANGPEETAIVPSFTRKGRAVMDSFLKEMDTALPEPRVLSGSKSEFERWYRGACFEAWHRFAGGFAKGTERVQGRKAWQQVAAQMATEQGPYFAFVSRTASELEPMTENGVFPLWLKQIYRLQMLKDQGVVGGLLSKAAEEGKSLMAKLEKRVGKGGTGTAEAASVAKTYQAYRSALSAIVPVSSSAKVAYQMASQVFAEEPATSKSPFYAAYGAAARLKSTLEDGLPAEEVIGQLLTGPVQYLWTFARMETACYLQNQWEQTVLAEVQGATGQQAVQLLSGPEGPVWKFAKGPAGPFMGWSVGRGHYAKEALGGTIPFETSFLSFLRQSAQGRQTGAKSNYSVLIKGLPTDANRDARVKPHSTRLELQSMSGPQTLVNSNYPVTKTFQFAPDTSGDVTLQIEVGDVVLTKTYMGDQAFVQFLRDFPGGQHTFHANEFPAEKGALGRLGIRYITVKYAFSGQDSALRQMGGLSGQVPSTVARCWGQ